MERKRMDTYEQAVEYVLEIPRFTRKNTMEDTKAFLHALGDPDRGMKILHVAGTNGKGSVCTYLSAILQEAGFSWGLFTSPHLVDIRERFSCNGSLMTKEEFLRFFLEIYNRLPLEEESYHPTFFEYLFFMGMLWFREKGVDYCVLETGLGGRLDATNAVTKKELAVITHMGLDHTEYLGDTLEQIAAEKAGILQAGAPVVYWHTDDTVGQVLEKTAKNLGISAFSVSKSDYRFLKNNNKGIDFSYRSLYYDSIRFHLNTAAAYQMENAALAVRAAEVLSAQEGRQEQAGEQPHMPVGEQPHTPVGEQPHTPEEAPSGGRKQGWLTADILQNALARAFWAGRMEEVLPEVFVDGAHNEDGIRAFLETVSQDGSSSGRLLVFGVAADKAYEVMVEKLAGSGLFDAVWAVQLRNKRALSAEKIGETFQKYGIKNILLYPSVKDAYEALAKGKRDCGRCYIAGSLYLVGEIKELL